MAKRPKNSTAEQLKRAKIALTNTAADIEIQSAVAAYGYNETTMAAGWTYYNDADAAVAAGVAAAGAAVKSYGRRPKGREGCYDRLPETVRSRQGSTPE